MKYKHYIITRFNLPNKWVKDKNDKNILNEEWLQNRYKLFEDYCLPSLINQVNKEFEWYVYFDINTPEEFIKKNEKISKEFINFKPKYIGSYQEFESDYIYQINKAIKKNKLDFVLTTRLDNDDALNMYFVDELQKAKFNNTKLLEFPVGLTLSINKNVELREYSSRLNPFLTLLEKIDNDRDALGVYNKEHGDWKDFETEIVSMKPFWIQIIHEKNIYNKLKGKLVLPNKLKKFKIKKPSFSITYKLPIILKKVKKLIKDL